MMCFLRSRPLGSVGLVGLFVAGAFSGACKKPEVLAAPPKAQVPSAPASVQPAGEGAKPKAATSAASAAPKSLPGLRPGCSPPPRILTEENVWIFKAHAYQAQKWAAVRCLAPDEPPPGGRGDEAKTIDSSYFSGLEPGRRCVLRGGHATKAEVLMLNKRVVGDEKLPAVFLGVLSDHCVATSRKDDSLLFSLSLSDDLAVQLSAVRGAKVVTEDSSSGSRDYHPVQTIELRVVDARTGAIKDKRALDLGADAEAENVNTQLGLLGDRGLLLTIGAQSSNVLSIVDRTGKIVKFESVPCPTHEVNLQKNDSGGWEFVFVQEGDPSDYAKCSGTFDVDEKLNVSVR